MRVADEKTLLIPDRRGNNRIDSLRNIVHDPRVALLFLIPGCGETIRVHRPGGDLRRSGAGAELRHRRQGAEHGARGDGRARLLPVRQGDRALEAVGASRHVERKSLPTAGTILAELTEGKMGGPEHDRTAPERLKATLY